MPLHVVPHIFHSSSADPRASRQELDHHPNKENTKIPDKENLSNQYPKLLHDKVKAQKTYEPTKVKGKK